MRDKLQIELDVETAGEIAGHCEEYTIYVRLSEDGDAVLIDQGSDRIVCERRQAESLVTLLEQYAERLQS